MSSEERLIRTAYAAFNARDIDAALAVMSPDVDWENGKDGGHVRGHDAVRAYWTHQWSELDPTVDPRQIQVDDDGRFVVEVHQVVRDLAGTTLVDQTVLHRYVIEDGVVNRMDIA